MQNKMSHIIKVVSRLESKKSYKININISKICNQNGCNTVIDNFRDNFCIFHLCPLCNNRPDDKISPICVPHRCQVEDCRNPRKDQNLNKCNNIYCNEKIEYMNHCKNHASWFEVIAHPKRMNNYEYCENHLRNCL